MFNKVLYIFLGVIILLNGLYLMNQRVHSSFKYGTIDFGPNHHLFGIVVSTIGVIILVDCWRKWKK